MISERRDVQCFGFQASEVLMATIVETVGVIFQDRLTEEVNSAKRIRQIARPRVVLPVDKLRIR